MRMGEGRRTEMRASSAADTIRSIMERYIPDFDYLLESGRGLSIEWSVSGTGGDLTNGRLLSPGCETYFHRDSAYVYETEPVNSGCGMEDVRDVHTPGAHTIPLLCEQLGIDPSQTLKAMLYTVISPGGKKSLLFAMIRGDKNISINKLAAYIDSKFRGAVFRKAESEEIVSSFGEVAASAVDRVPEGVHGGRQITGRRENFVVGGNRPDYHRTGCCWGRILSLILRTFCSLRSRCRVPNAGRPWCRYS